MSPAISPSTPLELVVANRILANENVLDAFGHCSYRVPGRPDHYMIARSLGPALVTEDDLQEFTLEGEQVGGHPGDPYGERAIHGAIYLERPDVQAICHNHAASTIPLGITGVPARPVYHMASLIGAEVPTWDIADEFGDTDLLVRSLEVGRSLARTLGNRTAALMRGHGCVVVGPNLRRVVTTSVFMEVNCRLQAQALQLGGAPRYLSPGEVDKAFAFISQPLSQDRAWNTWQVRAGFPLD